MHLKKGFTLVELLAVLMIVAILTAVALPQYRRVRDRAYVAEAEAMLRSLYDSSERLAGEFGFRSYEQLLEVRGAAHEAEFSFPRLDMIDADHLPKGCCLGVRNNDGTCGEVDNTLLSCSRFAYKLATSGGYVAAKKTKDTYAGTYILLDRDTLNLYCQADATADPQAEACDVYGLDAVTNAVNF